jgi:glutathione synthase/RimK-type ligase-like ATP-grasp enzyme
MRRVALALEAPERETDLLADWHAGALHAAFAAQGVAVVPLSLRDARFTPAGVALPGFAGLPDAVFVRAIAAGSFEEVTRRLGILHALREAGVTVWNDARAIECCVDKSATACRLVQAGIATPDTWTVEGLAAARAVLAEAGGEMVLKPLFGAQGRGLRRITTPADLPPEAEVAGVYHLQRFVPPGPGGFADERVLVCAGAPIAAMTRRSADWITNLRRGGAPVALQPAEDAVALARAPAGGRRTPRRRGGQGLCRPHHHRRL